MARGDEFSMGFAFNAKAHGLLDQLDAIQKEALNTANALEEIQGSFAGMRGVPQLKKMGQGAEQTTNSLGKMIKLLKSMGKVQEKQQDTDLPDYGEAIGGDEDTEISFMTDQQHQEFERKINDIAQTVQERSKEMDSVSRAFSSSTIKNIDSIFEAINKGTVTSIPNFREIASLLGRIPKLAPKIRKHFDIMSKSQRATSKDLIYDMDYYQNSIKDAIRGHEKMDGAFSASAQHLGGILESISPVPRELELAGAAAGVLAVGLYKIFKIASKSLKNSFIPLKESIKGLWGKKDANKGIDQFAAWEKASKDALNKIEEDAAHAEATIEAAREAADKVKSSGAPEYEFAADVPSPLPGEMPQVEIPLEGVGENLKKKLSEELLKAAGGIGETGEQTARQYVTGLKTGIANELTRQNVIHQVVSSFEKGSEGLQKTGRANAEIFVTAIRKFLETSSVSKEIQDLFKRYDPKALSAKLREEVRSATDVTGVTGQAKKKLEEDLQKSADRLGAIGQDTAKQYIDGVSAAIKSASFSEHLQDSMQREFGKGGANLKDIGQTAAAKFIIGFTAFLGEGKLAGDVKVILDKALSISLLSSKFNTDIEGLISSLGSFKGSVSGATTDASYNFANMGIAAKDAFEKMGASKEAFLSNLTKATSQISTDTNMISGAFSESSSTELFGGVVKQAASIEQQLSSMIAESKRMSGTSPHPSAQIPYAEGAQMRERVGTVAQATEMSGKPYLQEVAKKATGGGGEGHSEFAAVASRIVAQLREATSSLSKLPSGVREALTGRSLTGHLKVDAGKLSSALDADVQNSQGLEGAGR
jgi:translation initiation factor 2 beta subunit (eIF-2beta)/eIF-5